MRSLQSIKSLPVDFRFVGDQSGDRMMLSDTISENVEESSDAAEGTANGRGHVGSDNDESPYCSLNVSAKDGASLGDDGDDLKDSSTPKRSLKQSYVDSKWSDTTPYASKKVHLEYYFFLLLYLLIAVTNFEMHFLPDEAV